MMTDKNSQTIIDAARDAFRAHEQRGIETSKPVFAFAAEGLKTLQVCHGGALTAALAFAGVLMQQGRPIPTDIKMAFLCFSAGLCTALISWMFTYFSQSAYAKSYAFYKQSYDYPYVHGTFESNRRILWGDFCRSCAIVAAVIGLFIFALGLYFMSKLF